jgi:hypothetical protein
MMPKRADPESALVVGVVTQLGCQRVGRTPSPRMRACSRVAGSGSLTPVGATGPAIFSDDLACDVRDDFRAHIEDGVDAAEASARVIAEFAEAATDPDEAVTFWVALAVTQSKLGRLQQPVRDRAIELIDAGGDVARWEHDNPRLAPKRAAALARAREQLAGEQPPPRRVRRPRFYPTTLHPGQVLARTSPAGKVVLLRVSHIETSRWATGPVLQVLDYDGSRVPGKWRLSRLRDRSRPFQMPARGTLDEPPWNRCTFEALRVRANDPDFDDAGFSVIGELPDRPANHQLVGRTTAGWGQIAAILDQYTRDAGTR